MQSLLNDNPLIADKYFSKRVKEFFKVLKKKFIVTDYWFRYEYQHRGSPHVHSVIWIQNAPDVRKFDSCTAEEIDQHRKFYDTLVSAMNPGQNEHPAEVHPSRLKCSEVSLNDDVQYAQLVNRVNRHTRHGSYCLRTIRNVEKCRFGFPKELREQSLLQKDEHNVWHYYEKRNDELLNVHNPFVAKLWRANTDCQIIASEAAIVNYLSKYATKAEPSSQDFKTLFAEILDNCRAEDPSRIAFSRLLMKMISQRDISACEVMHLLTSEPLYKSTRVFAKIYIGLPNYVMVTPDVESGEEFIPSSIIDHYIRRTSELEHVTLRKFAIDNHIVRNNVVHCRKQRVLQVIPKVTVGVTDEQDEIYFKQKLQLHKPFRSLEELKIRNTWKDSYFASEMDIWELNDHVTSPDDVEDVSPHVIMPREWQALAEAMPHVPINDTSLGYRNIDLEYNWFSSYTKYPDIENNLNFLKTAKETYIEHRSFLETTSIQLNIEQQQILAHLELQLDDSTHDKLAIVQGSAGTGKSCVINEMVRTVEQRHGPNSVLLMAPTGVAANNINGQTIHSSLHLLVSRQGLMNDLTGEAERTFQEKMRTVKVIICDEMSMVGLRMLANIDQRLRQAYPENQSLEFGGAIIYFFGDFHQLPPVGDTSMLGNPKPNNMQAIRGKLLFEKFKKIFILKQIMRQIGPEQQAFRETLHNLARGETTDVDYELLQSRFVSTSNTNFENAIRLKSKKIEIARHNEQMLRNLKQPVALINARHNNDSARSASADEAQGLPSVLHLAKGCRVMLTQNLWTSRGLCNGTLGTVEDVIYLPCEAEDITEEFPLCVLVRFDNYSGPTLYNSVVPVLPQTVGFKKGSTSCTRKQFPLEVAYAITIHKSQGITVDGAVVDIGEAEFGLGLTYVALSRVRTLDGLLVDPAFPKTRLLSINKHCGWIVKRPAMERIQMLSTHN